MKNQKHRIDCSQTAHSPHSLTSALDTHVGVIYTSYSTPFLYGKVGVYINYFLFFAVDCRFSLESTCTFCAKIRKVAFQL